ncbi:MAG: GNAT family N-acetyltransferase [Chloroflexi bacterium]|nr:MAG: GNAT family N-acetyltransferase [Chloroflexota bacterium]
MTETDYEIRALTPQDRAWVASWLDKHWGSTAIVTRGQSYYAHLLPGFVAEKDGEHIGLVTYRIDGPSCELMTLDSLQPGQGIGSALIEAVKEAAKEAGCKRLWLITTNDNLEALRFYQKRGFELVAVHRNAIAEARRLKPQIPLVGKEGIPIRDEIELEVKL